MDRIKKVAFSNLSELVWIGPKKWYLFDLWKNSRELNLRILSALNDCHILSKSVKITILGVVLSGVEAKNLNATRVAVWDEEGGRV